jgi:hypothetical protein
MRAADFRQAIAYAKVSQRMELGFTRMAIAILLPFFLWIYSGRLALIVAIPCFLVFCWYFSRAIRRFLKREH